MLKHVDPARPRNMVYRGYTAFVGSPPGAWMARNIVWKLDPHLMRHTGGNVGAAWPIPTALLETKGAKTGAPRRNAVIYFSDRDSVILIASLAGAPKHPAWFHNLVAHPDVTFGGESFTASVVTDDAERHRLFTLGDRVYSPYAKYRRDASAAGRTIPIVQLRPRG